MPTIDRNGSKPYYQQVYEQIAQGIESGLYPAGKKLPSIRECARELGVSNTTIEMAYQRLSAEGYVTSRRGSGYTICSRSTTPESAYAHFSDEYKNDQELLGTTEQEGTGQPKPQFDFANNQVDASLFPFALWARVCRDVLFSEEAKHACLYNDRQGLRELREQLAHYVGSEYGLNCTADQVLVMPTTRDLISEITALFDAAKTTIVMEDPGYSEVGKYLGNAGFKLRSLPVFPYPTWDQAEGILEGANLVFTTPISQFPSDYPMPVEMREALVNWASEHGAYLVDDEYGCEFQSGSARMPSLGSLDREGRVITIGTFSSSFTPAICLSYAVLPPQLMLKWRKTRRKAYPETPWQTQAAMSAFMKDDHWRTHIRKIRTAMQRKRKELKSALLKYVDNNLDIISSDSSLYLLVQTHDGRSESELIEAAAAEGVRVYPTSQYWHDAPPKNWHYVLVGFASIPLADIDAGARALVKSWRL